MNDIQTIIRTIWISQTGDAPADGDYVPAQKAMQDALVQYIIALQAQASANQGIPQ